MTQHARWEAPEFPANFQQFNVPLPVMWMALAFQIPTAMAAEALRFTGRRVEAAGDLLSSLVQSKSLADTVEAQTKFAKETMGELTAGPARFIQQAQDIISREAA